MLFLWVLQYLICLLASALVVQTIDPAVCRLEAWVEKQHK